MPEEKFSLDITNINNFIYDMSRCIKCKGCTWVDHIYMPGVEYGTRCPSATKYLYDAYGAYGRLRCGLGAQEGKIDYNDKYLEVLYSCQLCGACDVGCKRNLDLEIELTLEAMRVDAVKKGAGPLPKHKKIAQNILDKHNCLGLPHESRGKWLPKGVKPATKADVLFFAGCMESYSSQEVAQAAVKILDATGTKFMLAPDEWCCGNIIFSIGMYDEAKALAERNVEMMRKSGAKTLITACAECYRTWKVDYPKLLGIATSELGFKVLHLTEYVDQARKAGTLNLTKPIDLRATYHDSCSISRLSEPWTPWEGTRGLWGVVSPKLERRRGSGGIYAQPREALKSIPGLELVEMVRIRENAFCCGAGRGTTYAFPDLSNWSAEQRLKEVKEVGAEAIVATCPWCKDNFTKAAKRTGLDLKVYDFSEIILAAMEA